MREIIKLGIFLLVVGGLAGLGVGYVNSLTEPVIRTQAEEKKLEGLKEVYPEADKIQNETSEYLSDTASLVKAINIAYKSGKQAGVIYTVIPSGYSGTITLLVGFDISDRQITNIKILEQAETPGLGAQCTKPWFAERFQGKNVGTPLEVVKSEPVEKNQVEAITASTITSEAITRGVNAAQEHFVNNFE